jgi:hypothetical protein
MQAGGGEAGDVDVVQPGGGGVVAEVGEGSDGAVVQVLVVRVDGDRVA